MCVSPPPFHGFSPLCQVSVLPKASPQAGEYSEGSHRISLSCPDGSAVSLHADDSLVAKQGANAAEPLAVRQVMEVSGRVCG